MLWVLLDVAIGVLSLALVGLVAFLLYKRVRRMLGVVGEASGKIGELTPGLTVVAPDRVRAVPPT